MKLKITAAGRAALVNLPNTGTNAVKVTHIGLTSTGFTPSPDLTAVPGEFKRLSTVGGLAVGDDTIHVTIRDDSADNYTLRGFGLFLADGTLFAAFGQADAIMEKAAASMLLLSADAQFVDVDTALIEFGSVEFLNPPATTEVQGVVELATNAEAEDGADTQRAVNPRGLKAFIDKRFGANAPTAFVKNLLAAVTAAAFRTALEIKSAALKDEGHGNGLNADLLDGKHASEFALAGDYAGVSHKHPISDVTGLQAALNDKANLSRNDFRDQQFISGPYPLVGFGTYGAEQSFIGGWGNIGTWRVYSADRSAASEITIKHNDAPRWNNYAMWHAGNFNPDAKMDKAGGIFTGGVTIKDNSLRVSGWASAANDGVVYFGGGNSYVLKTGASFAFNNVEGNFSAALSSGGLIWTSGNFDPAGKVNKSGDTMGGSLVMGGNNRNIRFLDNNMDTPCIDMGAGYGSPADRIGWILNRNVNGALVLGGRNLTCNLSLGERAGFNQMTGALGINSTLRAEGSITSGSNGVNSMGAASAFNLYDRAFGDRYWSLYSHDTTIRWWLNGVGERMWLSAGGALNAVGGYDSGSSRKLKDIEGPIPYGLAEVERLEIVIGRYKPDYNDDGRRRLFLVAEQLAELIPEAVDAEGASFHGERVGTVKLEQLLPVAFNAIKELSALVRLQGAAIDAVKAGR